MAETIYPNDAELLGKLPPQIRGEFEDWMKRLDEAHVKADSPYGQGSLWQLTGAACWFSWFEDGDDPADALAEDLSCDS